MPLRLQSEKWSVPCGGRGLWDRGERTKRAFPVGGRRCGGLLEFTFCFFLAER